MSLRVDFINTPLYYVLQEGVSAANCNTAHGIETYPGLDYILQSIFLRMTGFSEQKLRAIHWYIVNVDLEQRYKILKGGTDALKFGEYSNLADKQLFYKWIINQAKEKTEVDIVIDDPTKNSILSNVKININNLLSNSIFKDSYSKEIKDAEDFLNTINNHHFAQGKELLATPINKVYQFLYKQRNMSAHNSTSYQKDINTFKSYLDPLRQQCNFFTYYSLLLILDEVFIELYRQAKNAYENAI